MFWQSLKSRTSSKSKSEKNSVELMELHLDCQFARGINFRDRIIILSGDVAPPMFDNVEVALTEMENESDDPVTIKIHSFGGSVDEALAVVGRMRNSKCTIITEGYGAIMSAATLILAAGDTRRVSKFARFMHHCSQYELSDVVRHEDLKEFVQTMEKEEAAWSEWMAEFTEKTKAFWKKTGGKSDAYFNAEQLLKLGVVDEVF